MKVLEWLRRKCFSFVHGHQLIYNQCWEDPRLDRAAMKLGREDTVLVITSAGCNALDYLLDEPRRVYAIDMNPRQNALLELKIAGIRELEHPDFFAMFGQGRLENLPGLYRRRLRAHLTPEARDFWDSRLGFFTSDNRRNSFYFRGTTGFFAWLMNCYINSVVRVRGIVNDLLDATTVEEQRRVYDDELRQHLFKPAIRWSMRRSATLSLLGVPQSQRLQMEQDYIGGVAQFIEDCVRAVFGCLPLHDNYFWRVYITGRYTANCCPNYLKPEHFARLKAGLVDRLSVHTDSVAGFLEQSDVQISRYVLLDHMDWLSSGDGAALRREWQAIFQRAAPGTKILWRSAGTRSDFVDRVQIDAGGARRRVGELLAYDRPLAARLHQVDRVHTYGSFHIADLALS